MAIGEIRRTLQQIETLFADGIVGGLSDRELIERFTAERNDAAEAAFATLVERHGPMVLRVCRGILRNHQDAQDAFQATFLILAQKASRLWVRDSVGPWLHGVACRVAACSRVAAARRRLHERNAAKMTTAHAGAPDDDPGDLTALLHTELGRLPEKYRVPIVLCDLEGQTYELAARQLGCPVGTVKSRLARGRERLRRRILRHRTDLSLVVFAGALTGGPPHSMVPWALIDATSQLADRLHSGSLAIKVGPPAIAGLIKGVHKIMFLSRLKMAAASLVLACGLFSASMLSLAPGSRADDPIAAHVETGLSSEEQSRSISPDEPGMIPPQPKPWETVVRMRIYGKNRVGFGSGTIIHSTPEESIILTAAHHFRLAPQERPGGESTQETLDDGNTHVLPTKFPLKIDIDLFDGKLTGDSPAHVHFLEAVNGELVDYDFAHEVALVRIRPGRRLAASRVVPESWRPLPGMRLMTVGCSEGHDATAWQTKVTNPKFHGLAGKPDYEATECTITPKQGRSGGGLFTADSFLAGVCNYAEPKRDCGVYASPRSIYKLLDRNGLEFIYQNAEGNENKFYDQIRAIEEQIETDTKVLQQLKDVRKKAIDKRTQNSEPDLSGAVDANVVAAPHAEPPIPEAADHERRLRDVEQTLDRVLKLLESMQGEKKPAR